MPDVYCLASWPRIAPVGLCCMSRVIVARPRALASALVIGGTSLAALITAVKTIAPVFDGVVGVLLSPPHAATNRSAAPTSASRVIVFSLRSVPLTPLLAAGVRRGSSDSSPAGYGQSGCEHTPVIAGDR